MSMKLEPKNNCPVDGFKPCRQLDCGWFTQLRGADPQTGEPVDKWGCAVAWLPMLLIEGAQQSRQTGAAVESFRNEMVAANERSVDLMLNSPVPRTMLKGF
jgi:hypothetical protein